MEAKPPGDTALLVLGTQAGGVGERRDEARATTALRTITRLRA